MVEALGGEPWDGRPVVEVRREDYAGQVYAIQIVMLGLLDELPEELAKFALVLDTTTGVSLPEGSVIVRRSPPRRDGVDYYERIREFPVRSPDAIARWRERVGLGEAVRIVEDAVHRSEGPIPAVALHAVGPSVWPAVAYLCALLDGSVFPHEQGTPGTQSFQSDPIERFRARVYYLIDHTPPGLPEFERPQWDPSAPSVSSFIQCMVIAALSERRPAWVEALQRFDVHTLGEKLPWSTRDILVDMKRELAKPRGTRVVRLASSLRHWVEELNPLIGAILMLASIEGGAPHEVFDAHSSSVARFLLEQGSTAKELSLVFRAVLERVVATHQWSDSSLEIVRELALELDESALRRGATKLLMAHGEDSVWEDAVAYVAKEEPNIFSDYCAKLAKSDRLTPDMVLLARDAIVVEIQVHVLDRELANWMDRTYVDLEPVMVLAGALGDSLVEDDVSRGQSERAFRIAWALMNVTIDLGDVELAIHYAKLCEKLLAQPEIGSRVSMPVRARPTKERPAPVMVKVVAMLLAALEDKTSRVARACANAVLGWTGSHAAVGYVPEFLIRTSAERFDEPQISIFHELLRLSRGAAEPSMAQLLFRLMDADTRHMLAEVVGGEAKLGVERMEAVWKAIERDDYYASSMLMEEAGDEDWAIVDVLLQQHLVSEGHEGRQLGIGDLVFDRVDRWRSRGQLEKIARLCLRCAGVVESTMFESKPALDVVLPVALALLAASLPAAADPGAELLQDARRMLLAILRHMLKRKHYEPARIHAFLDGL